MTREGWVTAIGSIAALLMTSAASAVTITNRDVNEMKVSVIEGATKQDHILAGGKALGGVCEKGCIIRLNDGETDEYELEGPEVVSIEGGFLYYDGSESGNAPQGGAVQPARPGRN